MIKMMKNAWMFFSTLLANRRLLLSLVKNDFKTKYVTNFLGVFWAFAQPVITILIFWFVFQVGLKAGNVGDLQVPFILWFMSGIIPWFYIAESLGSSSNAIRENSFLVKKIVFRVSLLPIVKQCSALIVHLFFVAFMLCIFMYYGYMPNLYWLQLIYYGFCATVLLVGLAWLTSSIVVFFNDLSQIIAMIIQFGFWLTPIFWQISMVPEKWRFIFKANPAYYITQGYRNSLIEKEWFWEKPHQLFFFWVITISILLLGATVFRKLRPHFADAI